jgi:hypothetical protein
MISIKRVKLFSIRESGGFVSKKYNDIRFSCIRGSVLLKSFAGGEARNKNHQVGENMKYRGDHLLINL